MANSSDKERQKGGFYSSAYGERRKKRHQKGQTRMKVLLGVLVLLVLVWILLPHPTGDTSTSAPEDRTREFPITEAPIGETPGRPAGENAAVLPPEAIAPNPLLEGYVGQELRESAYRFEITYPNKEGRLSEQANGTHLFRLAGRLYVRGVEGQEESPPAESEEASLDLPFRVHFFSNKPEDYENFRPLFTEDISFQVEGDYYVFQLSHPEEMDPGLYYYVIEASDTGEVFYVGKVSVV